MRPKQSSYKKLPRELQQFARLALIARNDVLHGGATALVYAGRLRGMGSNHDWDSIVSDAYTAHDGRAVEYLPFECPECGGVHLGQSAALECCAFGLDDASDLDE